MKGKQGTAPTVSTAGNLPFSRQLPVLCSLVLYDYLKEEDEIKVLFYHRNTHFYFYHLVQGEVKSFDTKLIRGSIALVLVKARPKSYPSSVLYFRSKSCPEAVRVLTTTTGPPLTPRHTGKGFGVEPAFSQPC